MRYRTERVSAVAVLVMVGLVLVIAVGRGAGEDGGAATGGIASLLGVLTVGIAGAGAVWLGQPQSGPPSVAPLYRGWATRFIPLISPALLATGAVLTVFMFDNIGVQGGLVVIGGAAMWGVLWAQSRSGDVHGRQFALAQSVLTLTAYLAAFFTYSALYGLKVRSAVSATLVALVTVLLLIDLLSREVAWRRLLSLDTVVSARTVTLLSLAGGAVAGELTWGLNYWAALSILVGGAFLLLVFYVIAGVSTSFVDGRLGLRTAVEYSVVGAIGLAAIFLSALLI